MGGASKDLEEFIEGIPASKLTGFPKIQDTTCELRDFRLDMQGMASGKPLKHNVHVQVNKGPKMTTLKRLASETVVGPALVTGDETAEEVRKMLMNGRKI